MFFQVSGYRKVFFYLPPQIHLLPHLFLKFLFKFSNHNFPCQKTLFLAFVFTTPRAKKFYFLYYFFWEKTLVFLFQLKPSNKKSNKIIKKNENCSKYSFNGYFCALIFLSAFFYELFRLYSRYASKNCNWNEFLLLVCFIFSFVILSLP